MVVAAGARATRPTYIYTHTLLIPHTCAVRAKQTKHGPAQSVHRVYPPAMVGVLSLYGSTSTALCSRCLFSTRPLSWSGSHSLLRRVLPQCYSRQRRTRSRKSHDCHVTFEPAYGRLLLRASVDVAPFPTRPSLLLHYICQHLAPWPMALLCQGLRPWHNRAVRSCKWALDGGPIVT